MDIRPGSIALGWLLVGLVLCLLSLADAQRLREVRGTDQQARINLTLELGLTDLALMTETRYGRHLSQADLHAPFQDHPLAFDLFPSGALTLPPNHAPVDR